MSTYQSLSEQTGVRLPNGVDANAVVPAPSEMRLLCRDFLKRTLSGLPSDKADALFRALDAIEGNDALLRLSCALRDSAPLGLMTAMSDEFQTPVPACLSGFARDAYAFLFALSCVPVGKAELARRGVPDAFCDDIPERMIRARLTRYIGTGDIRFADYPWDMNFYCCAIVYLTRFYFIPCRCDYPNVFVNRATGAVVALWHEDARVRRDGQLDGVNGVCDPEAFDVSFEETDDAYIGFVVHPEGRVENRRATLLKKEWREALRTGDVTLALHIPGGEGYTCENVRASVKEAIAYYRAYFPDVPFKGIWSESWLFDDGLRALLPPTANIVRVQRQFYRYPTLEGEAQAKLEVFGDADADIASLAPKTSLERGMLDTWRSGGRFHTTGMFVLTDDADDIGRETYLSRFAVPEGRERA